jgi:hypothetical protein
VCAIEVSRSQGLRADADFKKLTDFRISTIKPLLPKWLHRAWSRVADDPEMVKRGWKKCGLRAPFDETKEDVLKKALQAMTDPDHYLFPLFPNSDRTSLPPEVLRGEVEPETGQAGEPLPDVAAGEAEDAEDEETVQRVRALGAAEQTAQQQHAPAQPVHSSNVALYPLFSMAARRQQAQ